MKMLVVYRERNDEKQVFLERLWFHGNILYGYKDRFNTVAIAKEDIICIKDQTTGFMIFPE